MRALKRDVSDKCGRTKTENTHANVHVHARATLNALAAEHPTAATHYANDEGRRAFYTLRS